MKVRRDWWEKKISGGIEVLEIYCCDIALALCTKSRSSKSERLPNVIWMEALYSYFEFKMQKVLYLN